MSNAFKVNREDVFLGRKLKHGESGSNSFVRLAKKGTQWERPVHEVWNTGVKTAKLDGHLTHFSITSIAQFAEKINTYSSQNAKYLHEQGQTCSAWQIVLYPLGKFFTNYVVKQGFRDGTHGFVHALFMSFHSFLTRSKLWLSTHR